MRGLYRVKHIVKRWLIISLILSILGVLIKNPIHAAGENKVYWQAFLHERLSKICNECSFGYHYSKEKNFVITIPGTEQYYNSVKGDVTRITLEVLEKYEYDAYTVKTVWEKQNKNTEKEKVWMRDVFDHLSDEVIGKKRYCTYGIAFDINPEPMKFIFTTYIKSNDKYARQKALKIEKDIKQYIKTLKRHKRIANDSFIIVIKSDDHKKLN
jgi:Protein of unknown function (DUF4030)